MKIGVIALDARQEAIVNELIKQSIDVTLITTIDYLDTDFDVLILPIKGCNEEYIVQSKEYSFNLKKYLDENSNVLIISGVYNPWICQITLNAIFLMNIQSVVEHNARLTAQCLVAEIIKRIDCDLCKLSVDVIGYGNCGKQIVSILKGIVGNIRVIDKIVDLKIEEETTTISYILYEEWVKSKPYSLIINTAPTLVITKEIMKEWRSKPYIFDIASNQGGVEFEWAKRLSIEAILLPSLPSIYVPITSGKLLARAIVKELGYE